MTLDIAKFMTNAIKMQMKIHHLDLHVKTAASKDVPKSVDSMIKEEYGDTYLLDSNYIVFFWGAISKDTIDKLFSVVDKALGESANRLTKSDFKKIGAMSKSTEKTIVKTADEIDQLDEDAEAEDIEVAESTDDADIEDDEETEEVEIEVENDTYMFLKITTK